jgi:predicted DNA-binding transcriptional regulator YafY
LNEAEIQALFLARSPRLLDDLGLGKAAEAAFIKLFAVVPPAARHDAESASQRIYIDVTGWNRSEDSVPLLPILQDAVWKERKLKFKYQRGDDCDVERIVGPLGLVAKGSVWYLVAAVDGDIRNYRVSRVLEAELTDQPFVRPAEFDLVAHWHQSQVEFKSKLPRYLVTARVRHDAVNRLYVLGGFSRVERVEPLDEADDANAPNETPNETPNQKGWSKVTIRFQFEEDACERLLGLGDQVEVLDPPELPGKMVDRAQRLIAFYAGRSLSNAARITPFDD